MKKFIDDFITAILLIISIIIFLVTVYFCLDVFGIIQVPQKYSIASLFYSQIEVIASSEEISNNVVPNNDEIKESNPRVIKIEKNNNVSADDTLTSEYWKLLEQQNKEKPIENIELDENTTSQNFYYEQLDEYGKIIYDKLDENLDELKTGTYNAEFGLTFDELLHQENGTEVLNNSFQLAINAITFDNPDLFYLDVTKLYLLTEITTRAFSKTYEVSIGANGASYLSDNFSNEENVNNAINNIEQIKNEILSSVENENDIEKIKIVHDYLVDSIEYDSSAGENIYNVYGALINKRAVCEGYARSFKYIMDDLGIPCIIACGIAKNSTGAAENHAWNYVQLDNKWYAVDVTWDDPVIIGEGKISESIKYEYFLRGSNKFFEDHFEDGNIVGESNFKYPALSVIDYK